MRRGFKSRYIYLILSLFLMVGVFLPGGGALAKDAAKKAEKYAINIDISINDKDKLSKKHDKDNENELTLGASEREVKVYKLKFDKEMSETERLKFASTYDGKDIAETEKELKGKIEKVLTPEKSKLVYDGKLYEDITVDKKKDPNLDKLTGERIVVKNLDAGYYLIKETDDSKKIPDTKLVTQLVKLPAKDMT